MHKTFVTCLLFASLAFVAQAQSAKSLLKKASSAMGSVSSIQYSGTGMNAFFGQALTAGKEWPRRPLVNYTRKIDYIQRSSSEDLRFSQEVFGGQQQNFEVNGDRAWNVGPTGPAAQLAAAEDRQLQIWLTPHGFLRAATDAGNATVKGRTISFLAMGKFKLEGTLDSQNLVTRVATTVTNPVLGDMAVVSTYSGYKNFNGVQFPSKIVQTQGGFAVWDLDINAVQPNIPASIGVPDTVQNATLPAMRVESVKMADGVWFVSGGSHHSLVVEFKDYITVIEAPLTEERSLAVIAEAHKLVPNKPIKYLVSTHHHFDHSGGLRTYVAEGATIVTHASNQTYFELNFKSLAKKAQKSKASPAIQPVTDKFVITDGQQIVEVYPTQGDSHTDELMIAYLPGPKILVEADSYSPGPANAAVVSTPAPNALVLWDNIQRLKLDVATIAPIHGRGPVPMAEFRKAVGKS